MNENIKKDLMAHKATKLVPFEDDQDYKKD